MLMLMEMAIVTRRMGNELDIYRHEFPPIQFGYDTRYPIIDVDSTNRFVRWKEFLLLLIHPISVPGSSETPCLYYSSDLPRCLVAYLLIVANDDKCVDMVSMERLSWTALMTSMKNSSSDHLA